MSVSSKNEMINNNSAMEISGIVDRLVTVLRPGKMELVSSAVGFTESPIAQRTLWIRNLGKDPLGSNNYKIYFNICGACFILKVLQVSPNGSMVESFLKHFAELSIIYVSPRWDPPSMFEK